MNDANRFLVSGDGGTADGFTPEVRNQALPATELAFALLSASPDCVKVLDDAGRLVFMSRNGLCAMGIDDPSQITGHFWWSLWPASETAKLQEAVERANSGQATLFDAYCPTMKGVPKWWEVTVAPILAADHSVTQVLAVSRDITDLRDRTKRLELALAESVMLRHEVDHRVKNSLGIVSSLLTLQARAVGAGAAADALLQAAGRVRTIASVHDHLHIATDHADTRLDEYLQLLCREIATSVGGAASIDIAQMAPLELHPDSLVPMGLILAELISNAVKHGLQDDAASRISIALTQIDPTQGKLAVADDGPGLPDGFDPDIGRGMGLRVVLSMVQKIGGRLSWGTSDAGGAIFQISFPLAGIMPENK